MVTTRHWVAGGYRTMLASLLLAWAAFDASAAVPKRVRILDSFGRDVTPFSTVASGFRSTLLRELGEPVDLYQMSLELAWS